MENNHELPFFQNLHYAMSIKNLLILDTMF